MAGLKEIDVDTLERKVGFIKVMVKEGYEERWVSVAELIAEYREMKKRLQNDKKE